MPYESQRLGTRTDISLGEIAGSLWRRKVVFLLILVACLGLAALVSHRMSRKWRAEAQMVLVQRATTAAEAPKVTYAPPVIETADTQMAMLQSDAMPQRALNWLRSQPSRSRSQSLFAGKEWTAAAFQRAVTFSNPKETNVIQVSAEAASPEQAALMANAVCQAFLQWKKELAQQQVRDIAQSLQVRSTRAEAQMRNAEQQEKQFKQQHHMADVATQERFLLDQSQARSAEVENLQKEAGALDARLRDLGGKLQTKNIQIQRGGGVRDDAQIMSLQSQLTQLEMDHADAVQKYTAAYPGMLQPMEAKMRDVKAHLNQAIHGVVTGNLPTLQSQDTLLNDYQQTQVSRVYTAATLAAARRLLSQTRAQTKLLPQIDSDYKRIVRNVDLTNTLYSSLQSSLEAARLDAEIATGDVQFTQPALLPVKPFRPNLAQNLALAGLVGLFLGSLAVVLLEQSDRRVRTIGDVQRLITAPVVGSLPALPGPQAAALMHGSGGAKVMEAYRLTYANLLLLLHQSQQAVLLHRAVILVTSALPGEGKTVTARHLARTIARCGKRTVLVDADLRVPPGDKRTDGLEPIGLADVLRGKAALEEAIVDSGERNLLLLRRGRVDEESADLVSLPQMRQTLETLRSYADVVVIDSPACLERADVFFLAPLADCILQVIGAKQADESALQQAFEALTAARPGLMALFFNFSPEHRATLMSGAGAGSVPSFVPMDTFAGWDLREKVLLSENKTTKIIVQSLPGQDPNVSFTYPHHPE